MFIFYLPLMLLVSFSLGEKYIIPSFFVWAIVGGINAIILIGLICPHCKQKYYKSFIGYNVWAFKCRHCKKRMTDKVI